MSYYAAVTKNDDVCKMYKISLFKMYLEPNACLVIRCEDSSFCCTITPFQLLLFVYIWLIFQLWEMTMMNLSLCFFGWLEHVIGSEILMLTALSCKLKKIPNYANVKGNLFLSHLVNRFFNSLLSSTGFFSLVLDGMSKV